MPSSRREGVCAPATAQAMLSTNAAIAGMSPTRKAIHYFQHYTGNLDAAALNATTVAVLAEKPSVARDIASVLGATARGEGYLHGNGYVVTWAIGHLASLGQPDEIRPGGKGWRRDLL